MAESLATFVGRGMNKAKPKPAQKPTPAAGGKGPKVPLPGYPIRAGLTEPTQWGGKKAQPPLGGSLASMLGRL